MAVISGPTSSSGGGHNVPTRTRDAPKKLRREDVTPEAVRNLVIQDIAVHPMTVFPAVAGVLGGLAMVVIAANPVTLGLTVGGFFLSGAAFIWNYVTTGEERAAEKMKAMLLELRDNEDARVVDLKKVCEEAGFVDGVNAASGFATAYGNLVGYLNANDRLGLKTYRGLAQGANEEAVKKIQQALKIYKALGTVDIKDIEREQARWKREIAGIDPYGAAKTLQRQIDSHEERIRLYREKQERLHDLMARLHEIEAATENAYLRLVDLGQLDVTDSPDGDGGAAERLGSAVEAAAKWEREILGVDPDANAEMEAFGKLSDNKNEQ